MKIAAYCRVSTEKEAQIDSLEKQIEFFNEFTKKNGYELYKLYADEGISGKQIKHRKQFQQMMIDAKAKKFDKVVVKDVSRFARNTVDLLQSVRELKSYGVQVDFLNNGEVMEGGSEFILTILGAMAQQESANMSKRVKFGKDITAKKGRVPNLVFGYDKIPDERYTLKINEEEAKIVKEIFESYVYKGIGTTKIAWNLNDRGIRTKKTKSKWVQTSIVRMLKNPIYTGRVTNKKSEVTDFITGTRKELPEEEWIVVERPEMRIISDELFNRAQELLEQRSNEFKLNNKREKTEYVFSTLIYCKHCGYSFRRIKRKYTADGPEYIRWVCSGRNSMGVNHCPNTTVIDEEELLNAIKIYLKSIIKNKKDFMKAVEKEFEKITKLRENNERSEESLLKEIEKVTVKKQKYMEMFQNEIINIQELKKYTNPLNEDIARLERELKLITSEIKEKDVLEKELNKTIKTVDDILNNQTITNAMLKTIIDVIEVDSDSNVEVRLKLLNEIGTNEPVITKFEDIYQSVEEKENTKAPDTKPAIPTTVAPTTSTPTTSPSTTAQTKAPETQPQTTAHTHAWIPVTSVVHHDATYKTVWVQDLAAWDETVITKAAWDEQVLVQDAWDEQVMVQDAYDEPVYDWVDICNTCGHKFLDMSDDISDHMAAGCWSSWHAEWMQVETTHHDAVYQTVHHEATYQTVHHEAETTIVHHDATGHNETKWVQDTAAWDETVCN